MPLMTDIEYLRFVLQDVPVGGSEPMLSDELLGAILERNSNIVERAAAAGWAIKAGALAEFVDRTDGVTNIKLSQMSASAQKIAKMWEDRAAVISAAFVAANPQVGAAFGAYTPCNDLLNAVVNRLDDVTHKAYLPWGVYERG
jgi:hypothetical protein